MAEVTRQDIEETVLATDFDFDQFVSLITKHVEIQIPNELNNPDKKEELIDFVFNAIQKQDELDDTGNEAAVAAAVEEDKEEPEIKIDLNLGSSGVASADEATAPDEESEMEESVKVEIPSQGTKDSSMTHHRGSDDLGVTASDPPASASTPLEVEQSEYDKQRHASISSQSVPFADRKSHIIALVKESKWTIRQVVQIIDDKWGYAAQGKSSKTRVSKTIRVLRDNNMLYEESNGILMWRGE